MAVSAESQPTAFVGNVDAYERSHLAEEVHAARPNGDAAQPSSRCPIPGAKASSMVESQMAQVMPTDRTVPPEKEVSDLTENLKSL